MGPAEKLDFAKNYNILLVLEEVRLLRKSILTQGIHESLKIILTIWLPGCLSKSFFSIKTLTFTMHQFFFILLIIQDLDPAAPLGLGISGVKVEILCLSVFKPIVANIRSLYAWNDTFVTTTA